MPVFQALAAALTFALSAPLAKLLPGDVPPLLLAGLLYLGASLRAVGPRQQPDAHDRRPRRGSHRPVLLASGVWLLVRGRHAHAHTHEAGVHTHRHVHDAHHRHAHESWEGPEPHTHAHATGPLEHSHPHVHDEHHRHPHG